VIVFIIKAPFLPELVNPILLNQLEFIFQKFSQFSFQFSYFMFKLKNGGVAS